MIRESNTIGDDVSIGTHSIVEHHVEIGDRVRVHSNAFIPEYSVIEEGAWIGPPSRSPMRATRSAGMPRRACAAPSSGVAPRSVRTRRCCRA